MTTTTASNVDVSDFGYYIPIKGGSIVLSGDIINSDGGNILLCRFQNVTVPSGASISSATISFVESGFSGSTNAGRIYGAYTDNLSSWSTSNYPLVTTYTSNFTQISNGSTNLLVVTSIVSEIIARGGWASGNALGFMGSTTGAVDLFEKLNIASTTSTGATITPVLSITYTAATAPVTRKSYTLTMMGV